MPAKTYRVTVEYQHMPTMTERVWHSQWRGWDDAEAEFNNICDDIVVYAGDGAVIRLVDRKDMTHKYQVK